MFLRATIVVILALVLIGVASVGAIYFGLIPNPLLRLFLDPPERSARYYPQNTEIYAWLTLYPGGSQQAAIKDTWERLNQYQAFRERYEEAQDDFEDLTGINLETDLLSWVGPEISAGVLEQQDEEGTIVATLQVRDKNAAILFLDQWMDFLEDTENADFEVDSYLDFDLWVDESSGQAYALSGDLLLVTFSGEDPGDVLEEMIGLAVDESKPSLASDLDFQTARAALSSQRFASVYFGTLESEEIKAEDSPPDLDFSDWLDVLLALILYGGGETPAWTAASAQWVDRGIVLEMVAPAEDGALANLDNPAELLPNTTLAFLAVEEDYDLSEWRDYLDELSDTDTEQFQDAVSSLYWPLYYFAETRMPNRVRRIEYPDLVDVLDLSLDLIEVETGIELEYEFFDYLGGQTIAAVDQFDFTKVEEHPEDNPLDAILMIQYAPKWEEDLEDTMDQVAEALEDYAGVDIDPVNIGANKHAKLLDSEGYNSGYVLHDNYLTIGTTKDSLERIVALQNGNGDKLDGVAEYRRALGHLPGKRAALAWLDLHYAMKEWEQVGELGLTRGDHRLLEESLGSLAVGFSSDGEYFRGNAVLTFFPE